MIAVAMIQLARNTRVKRGGCSSFLAARGREPILPGDRVPKHLAVLREDEFARKAVTAVEEASRALEILDTLAKVRQTGENDRARSSSAPEPGMRFVYVDPALPKHSHTICPGVLVVCTALDERSEQQIWVQELVRGELVGKAFKTNTAYLREVQQLGQVSAIEAAEESETRLERYLKTIEGLVGQRGAEASVGSVLKQLYRDERDAKAYIAARGGISMVLHMARMRTRLRIKTGTLGGAAVFYMG